MNTYPVTLPQAEGSYQDFFDPALVSVARDGTARLRRLQPAKKNRFHVVHTLMSSTLKATFSTFYDANRSVPFFFQWAGDGATYTVMFMGNSVRLKPTVSLLWQVEFDLVEQ